jgi:hypothetical protein
MRYYEMFITDKNEIESIITEANLVIDSSVIVSVNKLITNDVTSTQTVTHDIVIKAPENNHFCFSSLYNWFYRRKIPEQIKKKIIIKKGHHELMLNLFYVLHNLPIEHLIMVAKYHNLYYKNPIFVHVLEKEHVVINQHCTIINWVYDHICVYVYKSQYSV